MKQGAWKIKEWGLPGDSPKQSDAKILSTDGVMNSGMESDHVSINNRINDCAKEEFNMNDT